MPFAEQFQTPQKQSKGECNQPNTNSFSEAQQNKDTHLDYKSKTFKQMKQIAELEVREKKTQAQIRLLKREYELVASDVKKVTDLLNTNSLEESIQKLRRIAECGGEWGDSAQEKAWSDIIEEYKCIINTQQAKFIRRGIQLYEHRARKYEQENLESTHNHEIQKKQWENALKQSKQALEKAVQCAGQKEKECQNIKAADESAMKQLSHDWSAQIKQLSEDFAQLKQAYQKMVLERDKYQKSNQKCQAKYNELLESFEGMEKHMEEKLLEVQHQMTEHRKDQAENQRIIEMLKKELAMREIKTYYSFGGVQHTEAQTEESFANGEFNDLCMQVSIKTLLEENERLKNTLLAIHTLQPGQQLPKEAELELKILLSMRQNRQMQSTDNQRDLSSTETKGWMNRYETSPRDTKGGSKEQEVSESNGIVEQNDKEEVLPHFSQGNVDISKECSTEKGN